MSLTNDSQTILLRPRSGLDRGEPVEIRPARARRPHSELFDLLDLTVTAIAAASSSGFVKRMMAISFRSLSGGRMTSFLTRSARDAEALEVRRQPLLQPALI